MISSQNLQMLPAINDLKRWSQSWALLDAILQPEWDLRYYSFNAHWGAETQMASMRDGSGDDYFLVFDSIGAIVKGFSHESNMSPHLKNPSRVWPGVLDDVPSVFSQFLSEPAFSLEDTTFLSKTRLFAFGAPVPTLRGNAARFNFPMRTTPTAPPICC